nr:MAG TPA: hypothetical protein [Caudoviricetes sp.]
MRVTHRIEHITIPKDVPPLTSALVYMLVGLYFI